MPNWSAPCGKSGAGQGLDDRLHLTLEGHGSGADANPSPFCRSLDLAQVDTNILLVPPEGTLEPMLSRSVINAREGWLVSAGRVGGFVAGAWAAALAHELGHALVAWGYGYKFTWPTDSVRHELFLPYWDINREDVPASHVRNIGMAGFVFSAAISETMLALDTFPKSDAFVGGFVFYDLINAVVYVARDMFEVSRGSRGVGDIRDMQRGGIPREAIYVVLLLRSAIVFARILDAPEFLQLSYWWDSSRPP